MYQHSYYTPFQADLLLLHKVLKNFRKLCWFFFFHHVFFVIFPGQQSKVEFGVLLKSLDGNEGTVKNYLKKQDGSLKVAKPKETIHIQKVTFLFLIPSLSKLCRIINLRVGYVVEAFSMLCHMCRFLLRFIDHLNKLTVRQYITISASLSQYTFSDNRRRD